MSRRGAAAKKGSSMSGPLYGGHSLGNGIMVRSIQNHMTHSGLVDVSIDLTFNPVIVDINDVMQRLQNVLKLSTAPSMTSSAGTSIPIPSDWEIEEIPLPDEDANGNGKFDPNEELMKMIEKRFDDVDQALRLLVDP